MTTTPWSKLDSQSKEQLATSVEAALRYNKCKIPTNKRILQRIKVARDKAVKEAISKGTVQSGDMEIITKIRDSVKPIPPENLTIEVADHEDGASKPIIEAVSISTHCVIGTVSISALAANRTVITGREHMATRKPLSPLFIAAMKGDLEEVKCLLALGVDIDECNELGNTPLHAACYDGRTDIARLLLERGADLNRTTKAGITPLHFACHGRHADTVRLLLKYRADVNVQTTKIDQDLITPVIKLQHYFLSLQN
eukprot:Em0920g2a